MCKYAGLTILTLLLLSVPGPANAWNLTLKVAGGDPANYMTVSYGVHNQDAQRGTFYLYPQTAVTLTNHGATPTSIKLDGVAIPTPFVSPTTGNHTLVVTYPGAIPDTSASVSLDNSAAGGTIYSQNGNKTWNTTGLSGVAVGSPVPVIFAPDGNYILTSYTVGTAAGTLPALLPGQAYALPDGVPAVQGGVTVHATFTLHRRITVALSAPTDAYVGQTDPAPANATITATSSSAIASYSLTASFNGGPYTEVAPTSPGANTFTLPNAAGTYLLVATATTVGTAADPAVTSDPTPPVKFVVAAATSVNNGCTSCHATSFPAIVNQYNASVHAADAGSTCVACHTKDTPHSVGINSINISATTFSVLSSPVSASLGNVGHVFCANCHSGTTLNYTATHAAPSPKSNVNCSSCHLTVHNPNPLLGGAINFELPESASTSVSNLTTPADFTGPKGITTDGTYLYVADFDSNKIRKVDASGAVSTIAGSGANTSADGVGVLASFSGPAGITTDGVNLYVCDAGGNKIRKVLIASGLVTTIAGTGAPGATDGTGSAGTATFDQPSGITTDGTNLYVTDYNNHAIRKVVIATGDVTTIRTAVAFSGPNGITTDGTKLYLADQLANTISAVDIAGGAVSPIAGSASFNSPVGMTTDGTNLYVADYGDNTIRRVVISSGAMTTIAGTPGLPGEVGGSGSTTATFTNPYGITTDGVYLYVTDYTGGVTRKLSP